MENTITVPDNLSAISQMIRKDWKKVNYAAKPYLEAMGQLNTMNDMYGHDTARSVVLYFLCNASTWRGEVAKAVKQHLKKLAAC